MNKYCFIIIIQFLLWHTCLSLQECTKSISGTELTITCPSVVSKQELELYDFSTGQLDSITSLIVKGITPTSKGPFTLIPANICLLRSLQSVRFPNNQITTVDPTGSLKTCLVQVITLDLSSNSISTFPSYLIYNMPSLKYLYFANNLLTDVPLNAFVNISSLDTVDFSYNLLTNMEVWALDIRTKADFRNNQISSITNKYFYNAMSTRIIAQAVYLSNNSAIINFTDAIYEMSNQCAEVAQWYFNSPGSSDFPYFTAKLTYIDFGTTQIRCSCDQAYFLRMYRDYVSTAYPNSPIVNATCSSNSLSPADMLIVNSSCASPIHETNSTFNTSQVYPKLCQISVGEDGPITNTPNIPAPTLNVSTYPYYATAFMNPGACYFTFSNTTTVAISCTNDTSNSLSSIPNSLLTSSYMANVNRIIFPSAISSLPFYACSLPSGTIDLSFQFFTVLNDATFPCLDSFRTVNLAANQITSVNMANGNWRKLTSLDLSFNRLTAYPYSILNPTPTSLRFLNLKNNSINYIDLFLYTLKNITINLDNNPINSSNILNPQNLTIVNNDTSSVNITLPNSSGNSTIVIQDTTAITYGVCNSFQSLRSTLLSLRLTAAFVLLQCDCTSVNLLQIYSQNGKSITDDFNCTSTTNAAVYYTLTLASCPNATNFQTGLCNSSTNTSTSTAAVTFSRSDSNNTGLIVGLVVGLTCAAGLVVAIIIIIYILKFTGTPKPKNILVHRSGAVGQDPDSSLQRHIKPRNQRAVKLVPITTSTSKLPETPVTIGRPVAPLPSAKSSVHPTKGIPIRMDPIRSPSHVIPQYPPNSNALNNKSSFRPIQNASLNETTIHEAEFQLPKPPESGKKFVLNSGGNPK